MTRSKTWIQLLKRSIVGSSLLVGLAVGAGCLGEDGGEEGTIVGGLVPIQQDGPCTADIAAGITIHVLDVAGNPLEASVSARRADGYSETLRPTMLDGQGRVSGYTGAYEKPGNYDVTVAKPGFSTAVLSALVVAPGGCHVVGQSRDVQLVATGQSTNPVVTPPPGRCSTLTTSNGCAARSDCEWLIPEATQLCTPTYPPTCTSNNVPAPFCRSKDVGACTANIEPGIIARIKDASGQPLEATVTIRATNGFTETLRATQVDGFGHIIGYTGAYERPGTYQLTVTKPGYTSASVPNVSVVAGGCHVSSALLELTLVRAP